MLINGNSTIYGVIGNPIRHSLSPKIHNFLFQHFNLNSVYLPFLVPIKNSEKIIHALTTLSIQGANITVPYKSIIIPQLDHVDEYAKSINSVNTIKYENGKWSGISTDGAGFISGLQQLKINIPESKILIVGAGGSAKAIAFALAMHNVKSIYIQNRTQSTANELVNNLTSNVHAEIYANQEFNVLINSTSVGLDGNSISVPHNIINQAEYVIDLIYNPKITPLLDYAKQNGKTIQNGLPMLLEQARLAFEFWSGVSVNPELMQKII